MRAFIYGLLAATALSGAAFTAQAAGAPFGAPSAPLTAEEKAGIKAEAAKIRKAKAAAAERALLRLQLLPSFWREGLGMG